MACRLVSANPWEKNWPPWLLTVSSRWPKWSQPAVTEPWLSCDLAVTEPWSYWRCRDWAVSSPWLSCDLTVTELWPRRDWVVTSPSHDWAVIIGPGAVTTLVTVSSPWAHGDNFFLMGSHFQNQCWPGIQLIGHLGINFSDILIKIISRVQPPILAIAHIAKFGDQM